MPDMSPDKTHALLEKLAEYVMTRIPAIEEKLDQKADKADVDRLAIKVDQLEDKFGILDNKVNMILEGMDAQAKRLETLTIDNISTSRTLNIHEDRLGNLEEHVFGARVREDDEHYKNQDAAEKQAE